MKYPLEELCDEWRSQDTGRLQSLMHLRQEQAVEGRKCVSVKQPVSLPREATHWPAAMQAAEPPDEPPGTLSVSQGLRVLCVKRFAISHMERGL